jgi:hypothetical protein
MVFNALSNAILKSAMTAYQNHPPQFRSSSASDDEYYQEGEEEGK